jgi:hypothetical protein
MDAAALRRWAMIFDQLAQAQREMAYRKEYAVGRGVW